MLSEGIDTSPGSNNKRVEEFLASSSSSQPCLSNKKQYREDDSIGDERPAHDEVRQTLAGVVGEAEPKSSNTAKYELDPYKNRHDLSNDSMSLHNHLPYASVDSSL